MMTVSQIILFFCCPRFIFHSTVKTASLSCYHNKQWFRQNLLFSPSFFHVIRFSCILGHVAQSSQLIPTACKFPYLRIVNVDKCLVPLYCYTTCKPEKDSQKSFLKNQQFSFKQFSNISHTIRYITSQNSEYFD